MVQLWLWTHLCLWATHFHLLVRLIEPKFIRQEVEAAIGHRAAMWEGWNG